LGEGLDSTGVLSEPAIDRTLDALGSCAAKLRHRNVTNARFVATEACRRARNCGDFVDRVYERTGLELEIIATGEEARLALAGCAPLLDPRLRHAVVFDIGGGSTEIIWVAVRPGQGGRALTEIRAVLSVPHGVVSLTELFQDRAASHATYREMVALVRGLFRRFDEHWEISRRVARGGVQMLGSSGTVTTLAGIHFGLPRYDRARIDGALLDFATIRRVIDQLVASDAAGLARQPCIGPGRADLMIAGCAILEAICTTWPVGRLRVADRGVREGILAGLMADAQRASRRATAPEAVAAVAG
jgi:exopolyphosphatase/guanosine-5'-triphosphate,3'-diphosphate pyrophosphatase